MYVGIEQICVWGVKLVVAHVSSTFSEPGAICSAFNFENQRRASSTWKVKKRCAPFCVARKADPYGERGRGTWSALRYVQFCVEKNRPYG